mmetsp:Transcript_8079/g.11094  ORF Transcript_8079/g.11094 Transcript_8079/m.11094 type:complete len:554 (-) Transcript_8079:168-1829(-)
MSDKSLIQKWMREKKRQRRGKKGKNGGCSIAAQGACACIIGISLVSFIAMTYLPSRVKTKTWEKQKGGKPPNSGSHNRRLPPPLPPSNLNVASQGQSNTGIDSVGKSAVDTNIVTSLTFYTEKECQGVAHKITVEDTVAGVYDFCGKKFPNNMELAANLKSWQAEGPGEIELHLDCGSDNYWASLFPDIDGCTNFWTWPMTQRVRIRPISYLATPQAMYPHARNSTVAEYHIVYSGESSRYMGYQAQANYYGFLASNNDQFGRWTRIMSAGQIDDLAEQFPTFYAKRHPFSRRYGPLNKADGIVKWYASVDRPKSEVIVLIDPDNWMTQSVRDIAQKVRRGQGLAQAAWYSGSSLLTKLWRTVCKERCNDQVYATAVPYFIHRDDLAVVGPLWKMYTLMLKERAEIDQAFSNQYRGVQIDWGAEMLGWNFACTHAGIKFTVLPRVQARDVDAPVSKHAEAEIRMIHMGRAWMPKGYAPAERWRHTEGKEWSYRGVQVWCKCNDTADKIYPWPVPEGTDFQSRITLEYLKKSQEKFGKIPDSYLRPRNYHEPLA